MGKFIAGVIVGLACLFGAVYVYLHFGFMNLRADQPSGTAVEMIFVRGMMDRWSQRNAPNEPNPVPATDQNLIQAVRIYKDNCALCHGSPNNPIADLAHSFYPRVPQFMRHAPSDMTEQQIFYITMHGVARTGMPAWDKNLSENDIWRLAAFLKRMDKLPAAVDAVWKASPSTQVPYPGVPTVLPQNQQQMPQGQPAPLQVPPAQQQPMQNPQTPPEQ